MKEVQWNSKTMEDKLEEISKTEQNYVAIVK